MERKEINPNNDFRYAILNQQKTKINKFFLNPMALQKLSVFIMDLYRVTISYFFKFPRS